VDELEAASKAYMRLRSTLDAGKRAVLEADKVGPREDEEKKAPDISLGSAAENAEDRFIEGMDDDFNTAVGIAVLHDLARSINDFLHETGGTARYDKEDLEGLRKAVNTLETLGGILGLFQEPEATDDLRLSESLVNLLIEVRDDLRSKKEWALADKIRDSLKDMGIILDDTSAGTIWKRM